MLSGVKPAKVPYTYEAYRYLPDDGRRYEVIEGDLYVTPAPAPFHQTVSRRLQHALMSQLEDTGVALVFNAPIDVILSDTTVVQPDLAILRASRKDLITQRGIEGPPDVAVEILSPSTRGQDLHPKRASYARFGIAEYWIVEPDGGHIDLLMLQGAGYELERRFDRADTFGTPAFEQVSIPLAAIFRPH